MTWGVPSTRYPNVPHTVCTPGSLGTQNSLSVSLAHLALFAPKMRRTFDSAGDIEEILAVHAAHIPRVQPAIIIQHFQRGILPVQVAHEDVPAPDAHLAHAVSILLIQHVPAAIKDLAAAAGRKASETRCC